MDFLKEYGISDSVIDSMIDKYDDSVLSLLMSEEYNVGLVIDYLKTIGVSVIDELLINRVELFYIDVMKIKRSFDKFETDKLVESINKDISYIDYL